MMFGGDLTERDRAALEKCFISPELACQAQIRRVNSAEAKQIVGRNGNGDYSGLLFPYFRPGELDAREYRLRRDHPDLEFVPDGSTKDRNKYLSSPGSRNLLYFPPRLPPEWLQDPDIPVVIVEGEKKCLAVWRACSETRKKCVVIGVPGVWSWRGSIDKELRPNGEWKNVKGPILDLGGVTWANRSVFILFDANVHTNSGVAAARNALGDELTRRGAEVLHTDMPEGIAGVNGPDDLLAEWGPRRVLDLLEGARPHCLILNPGNPLGSARKFLALRCTEEGLKTLHYCRGDFFKYTGSHYRDFEEAEVRSLIYEFLESAKQKGKTEQKDGEQLAPLHPTKSRVTDVIDALKAVALLSPELTVPAWLEGEGEIPAEELIACANGLLHLPTQRLLPHTPSFFGHAALPFDYDPEAPAPEHWLNFLHELWNNDPASIGTLQEWFGYCLTADTRQQKILLIVGPKRSGKGTIGRIQTRLLGPHNFCAPTLSSLTQNFGLAPLIGRRLALISDARLGKHADQATVAERLLSITGEDATTIDRKFKETWTGTLPTRFMILTNELPRILDASGALASRFIVLVLTESFLGREDPGLTDRLLRELPGILNWTIDGWIRLQERGHFVQPESATESITDLQDLGSPISTFIRDDCVVGPELTVPTEGLFRAWQEWCQLHGRTHPGTDASFGRDLRAAVPGIKRRRLTINGKKTPAYQGIGLRVPGSDGE